jgi:hypothetical protein
MREHVVDYFKGEGLEKDRWMIDTPEFSADAPRLSPGLPRAQPVQAAEIRCPIAVPSQLAFFNCVTLDVGSAGSSDPR